jgi:hypothetical protein
MDEDDCDGHATRHARHESWKVLVLDDDLAGIVPNSEDLVGQLVSSIFRFVGRARETMTHAGNDVGASPSTHSCECSMTERMFSTGCLACVSRWDAGVPSNDLVMRSVGVAVSVVLTVR